MEEISGQRKDQPFDEYRMLNWRWFWILVAASSLI